MTPEEQRIKIAEACDVIATGIKIGYHDLTRIPDYLNDLNSMREAEKVLTEDEQQYTYLAHLVGKDWNEAWMFIDAQKAVHATAAQRAEAFLRTLNLWKE